MHVDPWKNDVLDSITPIERNTMAKYDESVGRLLSLKASLQNMCEVCYSAEPPQPVDPVVENFSHEAATNANTDLADAINRLQVHIFVGELPLTKSHAERLVKALCSLIDSRLPK